MQTFSIIIPVKPGGYVAACESLKAAMPSNLNYEVLLAEGYAPSQQRNLAARVAQGDILYFLDDDSLVPPENLALCSDGMSDPSVAVVGGPSVTPPGDSIVQQLFGYAVASPFGSGAVNKRYRVSGATRVTTDKELILCNLAVRRSVFMELGGFNERLYPNEENEFMDRVLAVGYKLLHSPMMFVYRSQRKNLAAFMRQMFSYGRGRAEQSLIMSYYPITSFIPLFFIIYLFTIIPLATNKLILAPMALYVILTLINTLLAVKLTGRLYALFLMFIYPLMHVVNGAGLLWGLLNGKPDMIRDDSIKIRKIKALGEIFQSG